MNRSTWEILISEYGSLSAILEMAEVDESDALRFLVEHGCVSLENLPLPVDAEIDHE